MWFIFDSIEQRDDLKSRAGRTYSAYILKGERKGYGDEPNTPYEKVLFETSACTVIEHGQHRPNCSVVQFFQKAVNKGDTVIIKFVRGKAPNMWDIESLENLQGNLPTYEPLNNNTQPVPDEGPAWVK